MKQGGKRPPTWVESPPKIALPELERARTADRYVLDIAHDELQIESARAWDDASRDSAVAWDRLSREDEQSAVDLRKFRRKLAKIVLTVAVMVMVAGAVDVVIALAEGRPSAVERRTLRLIDAIAKDPGGGASGGLRPPARESR